MKRKKPTKKKTPRRTFTRQRYSDWFRGFLVITIMITGLGALPTASAAAPTLDCQVNYTSTVSTNYHVDTGGLLHSVVGPDNSYYTIIHANDRVAPLDTFGVLYKFNPNCSLAWSVQSDVCVDTSGVDTCGVKALHLDLAGRVVTAINYVRGSPAGQETYIEVRNPVSGALLNRSIDLQTLSPALAADSITSVPDGATDLDYVFADQTADKIVRMNRALDTVEYSTAATNPTGIYCCGDFSTSTPLLGGAVPGGGDSRWTTVDPADGSTDTTQNSGPRLTSVGDFPPIRSYLDADQAFGANTAGTAGAPVMTYNTMTISTGAVSGAVTVTPNTVNGVNAQVINYDLDSNDDLLVCGGTLPGGFNQDAYIAKIQTSDDTQAWYSLLPQVNAVDVYHSCDVDYSGNVWAVLRTTDGTATSAQVHRYTGGDLSAVTERRDTVTLSDETTTAGGNPLEEALVFFEDSWGFDGRWLFGMLIVGMVLWGSRNAKTLFIAIMGFIGIGVAVALELFPVWVLFVLIFLVIAVAATRLFGDSGDEGGTA